MSIVAPEEADALYAIAWAAKAWLAARQEVMRLFADKEPAYDAVTTLLAAEAKLAEAVRGWREP